MSDGWFHTWPERSYDRLDGATPQTSPCHREPVPLSSLLSHMSLAYSPITKGLHILETEPDPCSYSSEPSSPCNESNKNTNDLAHQNGRGMVVQNCLKNLENVNGEKWTSKIRYDASEVKSSANEIDSKSGPRNDVEFSFVINEDVESSERTGDEEIHGTEASSFSSIVSSLSDASPSNADDSVSVKPEEDDKSQKSFECSERSQFFSASSPKVEKKKGLSGFFTKNVFSWKGPSSSANSQPSWKFLGKAFGSTEPPKESLDCHTPNSSTRGSSTSINDGGGTQKYGDVVASSSALILLDRPASLPAKSEDEQVKHRLEYRDIVEAAKRKDKNDVRQRKKSLLKQLKHEEQLANAVKIWNLEILPKWNEQKDLRRTRDLWWAGLPPCVRSKVWRLAVENDLNITEHLYQICTSRAQERLKCSNESRKNYHDNLDGCDKESSMELIQLDIDRTFPQLCIFQKGGPYYDMLHCVLGAYVCYRPDVGYVQGMSFLAAILILNLEPSDAFICFANLLNRPCLHSFFTLSQPMVEAYYDTFCDLLRENLPRLHEHLAKSGLTPDLYLLDWVYSVFGKAFNLDVTCRIWDLFLRDGEQFIFQCALGILHMYQNELIELDFVHGAQFLTRLPETLSSDLLFKSIASIKMNAGKKSFEQIIASYSSR